jgi:hypothetical protein
MHASALPPRAHFTASAERAGKLDPKTNRIRVRETEQKLVLILKFCPLLSRGEGASALVTLPPAEALLLPLPQI